MMYCDARQRGSVKGVLVALTEQVLAQRLSELDEVSSR
jgi:hypothetical protein